MTQKNEDILGEFNAHVDNFMRGMANIDPRFKNIGVVVTSILLDDEKKDASYAIITNIPAERHLSLFEFMAKVCMQNAEKLELLSDDERVGELTAEDLGLTPSEKSPDDTADTSVDHSEQ